MLPKRMARSAILLIALAAACSVWAACCCPIRNPERAPRDGTQSSKVGRHGRFQPRRQSRCSGGHEPALRQRVKILLGNGDGTFRSGPAYAVGMLPILQRQQASGAERRSRPRGGGLSEPECLCIMLGNGDGTFQAPVAYPTNGRPVYVATGKFAGSGNLDIVDLTGNAAECNCVESAPRQWRWNFPGGDRYPCPLQYRRFRDGGRRFQH